MRSSNPRKARAQDNGKKAHPLNGGIHLVVFTK